MGAAARGGCDMSWRITVLPGDGIGREVTKEAIASLEQRVDVTWIGAGAERYLATPNVATQRQAFGGSDLRRPLL